MDLPKPSSNKSFTRGKSKSLSDITCGKVVERFKISRQSKSVSSVLKQPTASGFLKNMVSFIKVSGLQDEKRACLFCFLLFKEKIKKTSTVNESLNNLDKGKSKRKRNSANNSLVFIEKK